MFDEFESRALNKMADKVACMIAILSHQRDVKIDEIREEFMDVLLVCLGDRIDNSFDDLLLELA